VENTAPCVLPSPPFCFPCYHPGQHNGLTGGRGRRCHRTDDRLVGRPHQAIVKNRFHDSGGSMIYPKQPHLIVLFSLGGLVWSAPSLSAQAIPTRADRWNRAAMEWVGLLESGDFEAAAARVDPAVSADAFSEAGLQDLWTQISGQLGKLVSLESGPVTEHQVYHAVDIPATFQNQPVVLRVVLTEDLLISGFFIRPPEPPAYEAPEYVDSSSFSEVDVTVGQDPWALPGTLSVPSGRGPFPAVVLVHGSGPNDRDETVGGNRPFRDLALGLASRGIAVLRYEKRTRVYGGSLPVDLGLEEEVITDALAALDLVRGREEVDPDSVYLLGHSLGGMMAPEIAGRDGNLAGLIILAAPLRPFLDVIMDQLRYVASLEPPGSPARSQVDSLLAEVDRARAGSLAPEQQVLGARWSYWKELEAVDPLASAKELDIPILVLQGGRDYQSTEEDFRLWQAGLGDRENVSMKFYPELNHLFAPGQGKATPSEYTTVIKHVDRRVLMDLENWIRDGHIPNS